MRPYGDVVIGAPDTEYSGASAAFGALHLLRPEMHRTPVDGIDEAWAITGPPALCVMFARMGALGGPFDLVVSGINPGANVGRAVYHSGTVGAAVTARNGGVTGVAVSQAVDAGSVMGQAWDDMIKGLKWESAAAVAAAAVEHIVANPLDQPGCLNINVPNLDVADMKGWRRTEIGATPTRTMTTVDVEAKEGHDGSYYLRFNWGPRQDYPPHTDVGAVAAGYVSTTWLGEVAPVSFAGSTAVEAAIERFVQEA